MVGQMVQRPKISLVFPYYDNGTMYGEQVRVIRGYPAKVKDGMELVVVDDGSRRCALVPEDCGVRAVYGRVVEDVAWNIPGARNVGMGLSSGEWVILTDIDHVVSGEVMGRLMDGGYDEGTFYTFKRVRNGSEIRAHPNTYFFKREMYEDVGGDDERTVRMYAIQEEEFRRRVESLYPVVELDLALENWSDFGDAKVRTLVRRRGDDWRERRAYWQRRSQPGYKPLRGSFPWKLLATFDPSSARDA